METELECADHGRYMAMALNQDAVRFIGMKPIYSTCPSCAAEKEKRRAEAERQKQTAQRAARIAELQRIADIPPRFAEKSFADYLADGQAQKQVLATCRLYAEDWAGLGARGHSLVLTGGPGTGKTHLACAIANRLIESELVQVRFCLAVEMIRAIRETYGKSSSRSETQALAEFNRTHLLIVDEIGVQSGSEHEKQLMFEVLNERYQSMLPTILISNLSRDDLFTFLGHRILDRYAECGSVIACDWPSYRAKAAACR